MFSSIAAYALAIFVFGPLSAIVPSLISIPLMLVLRVPKLVGIASAIFTAFIAYFLTKALFGWLDVHYAWYSFLAAFAPVILNDLRRASNEREGSAGIESAHLIGDVIGAATVLALFFL
ncbi:hypothetical protein [Zwartia sp.]|uniref:hypothetical protein n=1 Tax=Zwartia sp. TaxID=2978004 RepID=UPI0027220CBE|nr:hypothetical protein [Zwartia sp.]MDO9024723.1 hypothetical protein [Zwartia sp.]